MDNQAKVEETFTPQELNMIIDSLGRNFSRLMTLRDSGKKFTLAENHRLSKQMEDLRLLHLRLVKRKRVVPNG